MPAKKREYVFWYIFLSKFSLFCAIFLVTLITNVKNRITVTLFTMLKAPKSLIIIDFSNKFTILQGQEDGFYFRIRIKICKIKPKSNVYFL